MTASRWPATSIMPKGAGPFPALVAVHGGGWQAGVRSAFQYWGQYLAERGYVLFAISYRLAKKGQKMFPQAVQDVLAAVQFVRGSAGEFKVDPERIGLFGASAGAHLASLAALERRAPSPAAIRRTSTPRVSTKVKALVGVYGVYDLKEMWQRYGLQSPRENNIENFLGASPMENPRLYFDASPINYATFANNQIGVFLSVGTEDDLVNRASRRPTPSCWRSSRPDFFVRTCIVQGAPHYWLSDPIDEPGSYPGFIAPRLVRFLQERL